MKINDLSKELGVKNKDLIAYLNQVGFDKVSSHLQMASDDMIAMARERFEKKPEPKQMSEAVKETKKETSARKAPAKKAPKKFSSDDMITCVSVTPWRLIMDSSDHSRVYIWEGWGDEEDVRYGDLLSWRTKDIVKEPNILIQDQDLVAQWGKDLSDAYKPFIGVDYPEELFRLPDKTFEELLRTGNRTVRAIIQVTATSMIKAENYPEIQKIKMIDAITGTCLMDFLG